MVINLRNRKILAVKVRLAHSFFQRLRGLLGSKSLPTGESLWIQPCSSVHTFGMKYPIDVVFLNKNKQVIKVAEVMLPGKIVMCNQAYSVIELPAGQIKTTETVVSDILEIN